eukprot:SAG31_NODE_8827_length_1380_cov_1.810304_2_plen_223_part_01
MQFYSTCNCGNSFGSIGIANDGECNTKCDGSTEFCGGQNRNSVYRITAAESLADVITGGVDETFEYVGCYVDAAERTMNSGNEADANEDGAFGSLGALATPHMCADMCAGFQYFGLQYANQCFCGNEYDSGGEADSSDCNMACTGDDTIMCGGSWRNSVYHITGEVDLDVLQTAVTYSYVGCYVDSNDRDLSARANNMGQQASPRMCAELCVGYDYYGLQAGT